MVRVLHSYSMRDLSGARRRSGVDKFLFHENLSVNLDLGDLFFMLISKVFLAVEIARLKKMHTS